MKNDVNTAYSTIRKRIESVSLEIVLTDLSDPMAFKNSLAMLKEIHGLAKEKGLVPLAQDASTAAKTIQQIRKSEIYPEQGLDAVNTILTRMDRALDPDTTQADISDTEEKQAPAGKTNQEGPQAGTRHPATLPPHLSMEDFEVFLSTKIPVLETLESLILEFENGDTTQAPREMKRLLHTMKGESGFLGLADVERICHRTEDLLLKEVKPDFAEILLRVKDWFLATFNSYSGGNAKPEHHEDILTLLDAYNARLQTPTQSSDSSGQSLQEKPAPAPLQDAPETDAGASRSGNGIKRPVQIDADRLDHLIDIIGELAIAEAMVSRGYTREKTSEKDMQSAIAALSESTKALQKIGLSLRMVPLKPLFSRMKRVARDLAKKQGKPIAFSVKGESTELDKNLVDGLADPLIHIIRNSIDHGIESSAQDRTAAGKPETASVMLKGSHKGGNLIIEIRDDGKGIDREKLIKKALAAGIVDDESKLDDTEILNLIFESGLSTADQVTDISGRGIGMDVVRTTISEFNGTIFLNSEPGKGTTVSIKLPLSLSIMDGMVVGTEKEKYVIPTLSIVSSVEYTPQMVSTAMGKNEFIRIRETFIPLLDLDTFFTLPGSKENEYQKKKSGPAAASKNDTPAIVVVVEDAGLQAGLLIRELVSKQSIVRKSLTGMVRQVPGISGGTILADGRVCLILDVAALVAAAHGKPY